MYKNKAKSSGWDRLDDAVRAAQRKRKVLQDAGRVMTIEVPYAQWEIFQACTETGQDMILNVKRRGSINNLPAKPYNLPAKPFLGKVVLIIQ